jgi:hypothetical protein
MFSPCVPPARSKNVLLRALRFVWTLPTNLLGHAVGLVFTRALPARIGGPAASAALYRLPDSRFTRALAAIAIGDVVLVDSAFIAGSKGGWVIAHELSHTRQHTWLGPFYLPLQFMLQVVSALVFVVRPMPNFTPQHAYNPLERLALYVPFDVLVDPAAVSDETRHRIWDAFGVS